MSNAKQIIDALGGRRAVSIEAAIPYTTVTAWELKGQIPFFRRAEILAAARAAGRQIEPETIQYLSISIDPKRAALRRPAQSVAA